MTERTLEQAFDAYFFSKKEFSFLDFNSIQLELEVERHEFKGKVFYVPSKKLKQYLRFIDKVILRYCRYNEDVVHSYVKGRSALTAVKAHANNTHFFTTDIKSFFPNVHLSDVREALNKSPKSAIIRPSSIA